MTLRFLLAFGLILSAALTAAPSQARADPLAVKVGFLRTPHSKETISILDIPAADDGLAGAQLAVVDNNTTGRFLDQTYAIEDVVVHEGEDAAAALQKLVAQGVTLVIADLPAADLLQAVQTGVRHLQREAQLLETGGQAADHPVHPAIAETAYLKAFYLRAVTL